MVKFLMQPLLDRICPIFSGISVDHVMLQVLKLMLNIEIVD